MCDDEILVFFILTRSPELYTFEIEDGRELFIHKASLLISVSFNLISNSSAVSTVIRESTDHAFPRASGF